MTKTSTEVEQSISNPSRHYKKAAALLEKWMSEEDSYDEKIWPALERELKDSAVRCRENDESST